MCQRARSRVVTRAAPVGSGSPRIRKAKRRADIRLAMVPTFAPAPARNTR